MSTLGTCLQFVLVPATIISLEFGLVFLFIGVGIFLYILAKLIGEYRAMRHTSNTMSEQYSDEDESSS